MSKSAPTWITEVRRFARNYAKTRKANPTWTLDEIAKHLNTSPRTTYRTLALFRHLRDPRISSCASVNKAYQQLRTHFGNNPDSVISEITFTMNTIVPTGDPK